MRKADIIIGCNYGDEGKGLAAVSAASLPTRGLNILINGGAQRGHTVELPDGRRHVFSHFGAACVKGYTSCADEDFMVNPILFAAERRQLDNDLGITDPELLIASNCRVTTVYDMMVNQLLEDRRGKARHGSCGLGIFETRLRYERMTDAPRYEALIAMSDAEFGAYCRKITDEYIPARLQHEAVKTDPEWMALLRSEGMIDHFRRDMAFLAAKTRCYRDFTAVAADHQHLIFEAGQGLALDEDNIVDKPHLTPSHTTSRISAERIRALGGEFDTRIIYVTRSYFTRHGAGPLPDECARETINKEMIDRTNMPNPYQQTIRYAPFNADAMLKRVRADLEASRQIIPDIKPTLMITHLNETKGRLFGCTDPIEKIAEGFSELYRSDTPFPTALIDRKA